MALAVRMLHTVAMSGSPYYAHPIVDAETYDQAARLIAAGQGHPDRVFWQPPGYAYFLGAVYAVAGVGPHAARTIQAILGALSALIAARLGAAAFGPSVGLAAGYGAALHAMLFYFDGELLPPSLTIFLQLVALASVPAAARGGRTREEPHAALRWTASGYAMGLAALATATSLGLVPALAAFARRRWWLVLVGAGLAIRPVTLRNLARGGEPVPISFNAGVNLFIGNNPDYDATVEIRPDREWKRLTSEPSRAGVRGHAAQSDYFVRKVVDWLRAEPVAFARLLVRKVRLLLGGDEIFRNHAIYPARADSPLLAVLLWKVPGLALPWGLLAPLTVVGLIACGRRAPLLAAGVVLYAAAVVAFFVTARYRVPMVPLMLVFAGANLGQGGMQREMNADAQYSLAVQLAREGRRAQAAALYRAAIEQEPDYAEAWLNLGTLHRELGHPEEAERCFQEAARLDLADADALVNLASLEADRGRRREALTLFRRAFEIQPAHALARENLELLAGRWGRGMDSDSVRAAAPRETRPDDEVMEAWRLLHQQSPRDPRLLANLLVGHERRGELAEAIARARAALARSPEDARLRFTLGRLLVKSGDPAAGIEELRGALTAGGPAIRAMIERNPDLAAVRAALR